MNFNIIDYWIYFKDTDSSIANVKADKYEIKKDTIKFYMQDFLVLTIDKNIIRIIYNTKNEVIFNGNNIKK